MKNINEQIDRIKQLFTEERLHGNLVENDNDELLTEQEKQKKRYYRGVERSKRKLEKKLKRAKSKEEMDKAKEKFNQKTSQLWADYTKNPKGFNTRKLLFKDGELKLYGHKDKSNDLMLVSLGEGMSAKEGSEGAIALIKSYFKEKFGKDVEDIEVTLMTNNKFKNGKEYIIFSVIDNSDFLPPQEDKGDEESKPEAETEANAEAEPESEGGKVSGGKTIQTKKSEGDFTKPLQRLGGAQKGYTYHLVGPKKAEKRDANGNVVATYIRESKLNKKSLFESVYTFDADNILFEQWTWQEGNGGSGKELSSGLSKKFDDAISQIGDGSSASSTSTDNAEAGDGEVSSAKVDAELKEEWKNFPCVYNNPNKKLEEKEDGTTYFLIDRVGFFSDGKCMDVETKEMRTYKCEGNKIVFSEKETEKSTEKDSVKNDIITDIEILTGDSSWWANVNNSALAFAAGTTAALAASGVGLPVAAVTGAISLALDLSDISGRRRGVKGIVDALDGWVTNSDLAYVLSQINYFKPLRYKDPVSGQLVPAITKIKELYYDDEGDDLIEDIKSVGTNTLDNMKLDDGTRVTADQFKEIIIKAIEG
jgi:hypothetical protein